jgi:hypothetical protein
MNPYLERATAWESFHPNFITAAHYHIVQQLGPEYVVRIESRLYIHELPADRRFLGLSDLGVHKSSGSTTGTTTFDVAPVQITMLDAVEIERIGYLTVRDRDGNDLITVIELLSPTNKYAGPDREQYLGKRRELLRSRAHFVEIDLLRGGPRMPPDELPTCDYCAIVSRVEDRPKAGVWPWRLRDPLVPIPIPLRAPDPDAKMDLKVIIDQVYDGGGYGSYIYSGPPEPRLSPDDAAWADAFLSRKP